MPISFNDNPWMVKLAMPTGYFIEDTETRRPIIPYMADGELADQIVVEHNLAVSARVHLRDVAKMAKGEMVAAAQLLTDAIKAFAARIRAVLDNNPDLEKLLRDLGQAAR